MKVMTFEAGVTVINALKQACNFAAQKRQTVLAEINDIKLTVERQDNPYHLLSEYKKRLDIKYEMEQIKTQRQK